MVVENLSFNQRSLIIKTSQVGLVEGIRWVEKGRMIHETKVEWGNLEDARNPEGILSSGNSIISARDNIWVVDCNDSLKCYNCEKFYHLARDC